MSAPTEPTVAPTTEVKPEETVAAAAEAPAPETKPEETTVRPCPRFFSLVALSHSM